jgi:prepilin-type N-terminal cleavage/methylation domain-containing protein
MTRSRGLHRKLDRARETYTPRKSERGMTLVELMISMVILATGLGALTTLLTVAMASDSRNNKDTTSTLLAQMVIEQISAQNPASNASISVTDCANNTWTINTQGGTSPNGTGANLVTSSSAVGYGGIDPTQSYSGVPSGYAMKFVDCTTNGPATTYDVRWNVMNIDPSFTRLITAAARPLNANLLGGVSYAMPVTLRAVGAP